MDTANTSTRTGWFCLSTQRLPPISFQSVGVEVFAHPTTERVRVLLRLLGRDVQVGVFAHQAEATGRDRRNSPVGLLALQTDAAPLAR